MLTTTRRSRALESLGALAALVCCVLFIHAAVPPQVAAQEGRRLTIESTLSYEHFSRNKVILRGVSFFDVLHIGDIALNRTKRDVLTLNTRLAYNVSPQMRLEAVIPLRHRRELQAVERTSDHSIIDEDADRFSRTREIHASGLGDAELSLHMALPPAEVSRVFSISVKAPTGRSPYGLARDEVALGSGHWSTQIGLSLQKVIDPVVLFGSVSYTQPFGREVTLRSGNGSQWVTPGSGLRYTLGVGLAVNPRVALSAMLEHIYTRPARIGQEVVRESEANSAVLSFGVRYQWLSGRSIRVQLGVGLTPDASDFSLSVSMPLSFAR